MHLFSSKLKFVKQIRPIYIDLSIFHLQIADPNRLFPLQPLLLCLITKSTD